MIYLIRHGGVVNPSAVLYERLPGFPLSEAGRAQIAAAADWLADQSERLAAIIASPLQRTVETGQIIAEKLHLELQTDDRLLELSAPTWAGKPEREFAKTSGYHQNPERAPGVEPASQQAARVIECLRDWARRYPGQPLAFIGHGDPLVATLLTLAGQPLTLLRKLDMNTGNVYTLNSVQPPARYQLVFPSSQPL